MNEAKSQKWISSAKGKALNVHKVQSVFGPVAKNPCNLISIFGRARQGKSFLMNCLSGEREIFKISNEKDSCTQGIDISNKWLNLSEFSKIDGGKLIGGRTEGMKVGFVDAEGQGDKDVSYDANLICPILLASKCVIFNWKGDLQKDHILSTLGIMARAAQNVTAETGASSTSRSTDKGTLAAGGPKFGHLHIIFRDWQAVRTDEVEVFETLLGIEGMPESATRDMIRADLLSSFESIRVWLFDAPSELTKDLRQKLTFEKTSMTFRAQVRALREALAQQLKEPTCIAGHALTGRMYGPLTEQIAEALNGGQAVLPSSAYLGMMRQEAQQLVQQYGADLRAQVQELMERINLPFASTGISSKAAGASKLYPTRTEADLQFKATLNAVGEVYQVKIGEVTGNITPAPGTLVATILGEYEAQVKIINANEQKHFAAQTQQQFAQWLMRARRAAEQMLVFETGVLEKKLPLPDSDSDSDAASPLSLTQQLAGIYQAAARLIGGAAHYGADCAEVVDAEHILQRQFAGLSDNLREKNSQLLEAHRQAAQKHVTAAEARMEQCLMEEVAELMATRPTGYYMKELEQSLNAHYHSLTKTLEQALQQHPERAALQKEFTQFCAGLRGRMVEQYEAAKERALRKTVGQARDAIAAFLSGMDVNLLWADTPLEHCEIKLSAVLEQLAADVEASLLAGVQGWLLGQSPSLEAADLREPAVQAQMAREERFRADVSGAIQQSVATFREEWLEELARLEQQQEEAEEQARLDAEREAQGAVHMTSDGEEGYSEEEEEAVEEAVRGVSLVGPSTAAKKSAGSSTADQRRRAAEWAEKEYGTKAGKQPSKRQSKKALVAKPNVKSVEQQRADALAYAKKVYGENIGQISPPAKPAQAPTRKAAAASRHEDDGYSPFSKGIPTPAASKSASSSTSGSVGRKRSAPTSDDDDVDAVIAEPAPAKSSKKQASSSKVPPAAPAAAPAPVPPAPPAAAETKLDPVKAARLEAQRLAAERAADAASAAANRAAKAKAKKAGGK